MRNLDNYINNKLGVIRENYNPFNDAFVFESETESAKERKEQLIDYLKNRKYEDYVESLNQLLEDPKAKTLLQDGFGGKLGDLKMKFTIKTCPVRTLLPTQNEIDVTKSIDYALKVDVNNIDNYYKNANRCQIKIPLMTLNSNFIIDGHHRWSQMYAYNPDARALCFDYSASISPIAMLKATQGAIAAVMADRDDEKIPQQVVKGQNLYSDSWREEEIIKHIKEVTADPDEVVEHFIKYKPELNSFNKVVSFLTDNLLELKANNYPTLGAPGRGDMPQTDMAGSEKGNAKSALPDSEGSALNKLKGGKIVKNAVK